MRRISFPEVCDDLPEVDLETGPDVDLGAG